MSARSPAGCTCRSSGSICRAHACPLPDAQFIDAAQFGLLPLRSRRRVHLRRRAAGADGAPPRHRHASPAEGSLQADIAAAAAAIRAASWRARRWARAPRKHCALRGPNFRRPCVRRRVRAAWLAGIAAVVSAAIVFHAAASVLTSAALALTFLAWTGLRLVGAATAWRGWRALRMPVARPADLHHHRGAL